MTTAVTIVPYDAAWPARFGELALQLRRVLGDVARRIDHIGSTSVLGLDAKPIIDIQISVRSFEPLNAYRDPLESLGYVFRSENDERTKRYFREAPGTPRTHIHVRQAGSWAEQFALLFRDYLRTHPEAALQYAKLKRQLAIQFANDRHGYTDAKRPFTWEVMHAADRWTQETGWQPGPSDA
jgi:GrpB-like predicted nucleotidyltransferase (UPF0157 family)